MSHLNTAVNNMTQFLHNISQIYRISVAVCVTYYIIKEKRATLNIIKDTDFDCEYLLDLIVCIIICILYCLNKHDP